jgi:hypothetical protein
MLFMHVCLVNAFTLVALSSSKELRKAPATSLVLNLAFADLMFCLIAIPTDAASFLTGYKWNTSELTAGVCSLVGLVKYAAGTVDWGSLALISVERSVQKLTIVNN